MKIGNKSAVFGESDQNFKIMIKLAHYDPEIHFSLVSCSQNVSCIIGKSVFAINVRMY